MYFSLKTIPEAVENIIREYQAERLKKGHQVSQEGAVYAMLKEYDKLKKEKDDAKS